ncbi:MAG: isoprenylcysteine carboxylmethyltransferase family protein [Anaerolineales bacterium]|nr:isoprenylcysteine carboxylmethyltransferase family protein [Anaerolineales bacterium]
MKNILVTALATMLVPGVAVLVIPYLILQATGGMIEPQGLLGVVLIALALLGAGMVVWVSVTFVAKGRGTPVPIQPPQNFVAEGLYQFVRNPMYVGALLILFAEAILFRSAWILLYAGTMWLALHTFTVLLEEPQLDRRFGETYRQYKTQTPRWIPRRPKR